MEEIIATPEEVTEVQPTETPEIIATPEEVTEVVSSVPPEYFNDFV